MKQRLDRFQQSFGVDLDGNLYTSRTKPVAYEGPANGEDKSDWDEWKPVTMKRAAELVREVRAQ